MSHGWGTQQRRLLRGLCRAVVEPSSWRVDGGPAGDRWLDVGTDIRPVPGVDTGADPALRRAASSLKMAGVIETAHWASWVTYVVRRRPDDFHLARRTKLMARIPDDFGAGASWARADIGAEFSEHFAGLAEQLLKLAEVLASPGQVIVQVGDRTNFTAEFFAWSQRIDDLTDELNYRIDWLDRLPAPAGIFCWEVAFCAWLAREGLIAQLRRTKSVDPELYWQHLRLPHHRKMRGRTNSRGSRAKGPDGIPGRRGAGPT